MSLARNLLLRASRSELLAHQLPRRRFMRRATRRFMPGEELEAAVGAARELARGRIGTVFTKLGEQITSAAEAVAERDEYLEVLEQIRVNALPTHISVKLTHLGLEVDRDACAAYVRAMATRAAEVGSWVWIDMEESRYVDVTLDVFRRARAAHENVGLCLQAYLHRTPADLDALLPLAPAIRLVKGAYNEPAEVALPKKRDVDAQYFALSSRLLEHVKHGARPVFGTHDPKLIGRLQERAAALGVDQGSYEFHLLYGIRAADQRALAAAGYTVRVLISYGAAWFAWYMRRLAERPANVWFVLRNLV